MISKENCIELNLIKNADCLLFVLPPVLPIAPPPAVPKLIAVAKSVGLKVQGIDLNILLWHLLPEARFIWDQDSSFFDDQDKIRSAYQDQLDNILDNWSAQIVDANPRFIGFSCLFSYSLPLLELLIKKIKSHQPSIKIFLGGSALDASELYGSLLLIDKVILGNGEIEFLECLTPGITPLEEKNNSVPFLNMSPDYSDFNVTLYNSQSAFQIDSQATQYGLKTLFVKGSQGCVRECTFCNENIINPRYFFRAGKIISEEIIHFHRLLNVENFFFVDSLVNGSVKSFLEMCSLLSKYNLSLENKISLTGYIICRGKKEFPSYVFDDMKNAGFRRVVLGVETGSEKLRGEMKKGYSREELDWFFSELFRVGIKCKLLLMVGYPTETEKDFEQTIHMLDCFFERGWIGPDKMIDTANFGWSTTIAPGTELATNAFNMGINNPTGVFWSHTNIYMESSHQYIEVNNPAVRIIRHRRLYEKLAQYGIIGQIKKPQLNSQLINLLTLQNSNQNIYSDEELKEIIQQPENQRPSHFLVGEIVDNIYYIQDRNTGESYLINNKK